MSWPSLDQSVKAIDISRYNNWANSLTNRDQGRIDFAALASQHPEIRVVVSRAAGGWSGVDPDFAYNYDESEETGFDPACYVNSNPAKSVAELVALWKLALGTRKPKLIVLDSELTEGKTPAQITAHVRGCHTALKDNWPEATAMLQYSGAWWWDPNIVHGWESDLFGWPAHYIYVVQEADGDWRVAYSFEELDHRLPIDNAFTPKPMQGFAAKNIVAWQFTSKLILPPITRVAYGTPRVDGNYFLAWFVEMVFRGGAPVPVDLVAFLRDQAKALRATADKLDAKATELA